MDKKIRVAFLSRYQNNTQRGVETYVSELSKRLSKYFEVEILVGKDSDSLSRILKGDYDVILPGNGRFQGLKLSFGRILGKYKTIVVGHAGIGKDDLWNLNICRPNVFVALTERQNLWAKKRSIRSKIVKIPNGVDLEKFKKDGTKQVINLEKPIVLSVGSLHWYKNHKKTINAVSKMMKGSLLIIGDGPLKKDLLDYGTKLLGARFTILSIPYEKIPEYYRSADVFTLASWDRESFGIVYLEALASNLPVVAPDDLTRREIIGNGGILTNVDDPQRFALALEEALNKDWKNLPRIQAEKFSWDKICDQYVEVINSLI